MNAFFEFIKWFIKLSLAAAAIVLVTVIAFVFGFVSKRRARKEVSND
jgi:ABC-type sugar transport system permease subunit